MWLSIEGIDHSLDASYAFDFNKGGVIPQPGNPDESHGGEILT
jgi:hypothetical protein